MSAILAYIRADAVQDAPLVPASWDRQPCSNRWCVIYPNGRGGVFFHARLIARASGNPGRALFVCTGAAGVLTALANQIAADGLPWTQAWASLAALRADGGALATAIKAAWPDERPRDGSGNPVGTLVALWARMAGALAEDAET